ncbi:WYL domain-containing protein [bacterium]|nr:WYL domain-containing protein [bacterium]
MKKLSEKYNEACLKIFDMLKLLSKGSAHYNDMIKLFDNEDLSAGATAPVILNKYLNTLKIFGINVYKTKNIYYLQNSFFSIDFSKSEIELLKKLKNYSSKITNKKQKAEFNNFLNEIELRLTNSTRELLEKDELIDKNELENYIAKHKELIEICENNSSTNSKLEVSFSVGNKTHKVICTPNEINYSNGKAYFSAYNHISRQTFEIPFDRIREIKQLPTISQSNHFPATVVFQIKGTLAKSYQLKEGEISDGKIDNEGWLTIINSNENIDSLLTRLMRYNTNCRVVSPKHIKERMINLIDNTLKNYL